MKHIAVIIPTYNEAGAIGPLLESLHDVFKSAPRFRWSVVVVDGNSPDGTGAIVEAIQKDAPEIHLIKETAKRGIGLAYVDGMRYSIETLKADAFVEFDGDGQHDPKDLPRLAEELERGADYVVASRYVPGGSVPKYWSLWRKLLSRGGGLIARIVLELPVKDATSGFKLTRISGFADRLPLSAEKLLSRQYAYKVHFLAAMAALGAKVKEIPIAFAERSEGASKSSSLRDIFETLKVILVFRLRTLRSWRMLKVAGIGGVGLIIQALIFEIVGLQLGLLRPSLAAVAGGELAIISNFFLNERFSFRDRAGDASLIARLLTFHAVSAGSLATQWVLLFTAEDILGHEHWALRVVYLAGVALGFLVNYAGYYFLVWRRQR